MRKAPALVLGLLCVALTACKPHPDHGDRGDRGFRHEENHGDGGRRVGLRKACREELEQFCASDQTGRDRKLCLQSHMDKLSADCKTALQERLNRAGHNRNNTNQSNQGGGD